MKKVVLDTNVLVSASISKAGNPNRIFRLALQNKITFFTTADILEELEGVLRVKFKWPQDIIRTYLAIILKHAILTKTKHKLNIVKRDPADNKILECAASCKADYIITGDNHLLDLKEFRETKIITPKEFLNKLNFQAKQGFFQFLCIIA
ncbi:putative toxin-antitoxin system toxin component, PIN family [Candidatus Woesearchaeota archaeon]|nr:putative toxin-antitoxin system toxin component, PIN family [Candidatus Woesearchaeota archaeon]